MKIVYYNSTHGNYGDEVNKWLWPKIFGELIEGFNFHGDEYKEKNNQENLLFYGIGTLLDQRIPRRPKKIIFGSGAGYDKLLKLDDSFQVAFVRGPKTAQKLGLDRSFGITDPAILLRKFFPETEKKYSVSFMPHIDTEAGNYWEKICQKVGINYITPRGHDIVKTSLEIQQTELLITEAMHGAIVADTLRTPWVPISSMPHISHFKWQDWCQSLNLEYHPISLPSIFHSTRIDKNIMNKIKMKMGVSQLNKILANPQSFLSLEETCIDRINKIDDQIVLIKQQLSKTNGSP